MRGDRRELIERHGLALGCAGLALLIRGALPLREGTAIYQLLIAAVVVSAWHGGRGPGLLASLICAAGALYWFIPPADSFAVPADYSLGLCLFLSLGVLLTEFGASRRRVEREQKRAAEALVKAQMELAHVSRVTTMGQLAVSIAHEVNQPLAAVAANASACVRWLAHEPPNLEEARATAARIVKDANRAAEVVAKVRALTRKALVRRDRVDINEIIGEVIALTRVDAEKSRVALQTRLSPDVPAVLADRVQMQQVLLNLVVNGVEAMSGAAEEPRNLIIGSAKHVPNGVLVTVRDSGVGLNAGPADRLFEPFCTTKPGGMGMGLAISRSIIESHGGRIWATPNTPRGAVFHFTLPADAAS